MDMDELTIGDKTYISSKSAAKLTGYAKDYIGQLCREGRVEARLVGRNWYVLEVSIRDHRFGKEEQVTPEAELVTTPEPAPISTWKEPEYIVETPAFIPVLSIMPEPKEPLRSPVVADMQSAWHDWFVGKRGEAEESTESEVSEEFQDEESIEITPQEDTAQEELTAQEDASEGEALVLTRVRDFDADEVPLVLNRAVEAEETIEEEEIQAEAEQYSLPDSNDRSIVVPGRLVLKSLFIGVAMIAAVAAVIGTGNAELMLQSGTASAWQPFISYLDGTSTYKKGI